jgi:NAD(P)-dependent dehydrogenase (short-subunit alcohol dehydrogenase family)
MSQELVGQIAVITGAGRGIGRALAHAFAQAGAAIAAVARSVDELSETVRILTEAGHRAISIATDVTDTRAVEMVVKRAEAELGPIDLLINNAGLARSIGPVWEADPDEWWRDIETNLRGPFLCCRAVLPGMLARARGRIINLASAVALGPYPYTTAYASSKAGLLRLTDCLASELASAQAAIRVFAVSPGSVRTAMMQHLLTSDAGKKWLPQLQNFPMLPTDRITGLAVLLASGQADALSGRFIQVADDVHELVRQAEQIKRDNLYSLRLDKLPVAAPHQ